MLSNTFCLQRGASASVCELPASLENEIIAFPFLSLHELPIMHFNGSSAQPPQVVAVVGDAVTLPCSLEDRTRFDDSPTVEWTRADLEPKAALVYRDNSEVFEMKHQRFEFRTSLFHSEVKDGNVSLRISNVQLSDAGMFYCLKIPKEEARLRMENSTVELVVAVSTVSVSDPKISMVAVQSGEVMVECAASCWLPKPEMKILDDQGRTLTAEKTETEEPNGCITVRQKVVLQNSTGRFEDRCFLWFNIGTPVTAIAGGHTHGGFHKHWLSGEVFYWGLYVPRGRKRLSDDRQNLHSLIDFLLSLSDYCPLTIDTNTASRRLKVSEDRKAVTFVMDVQPYPDHPDRFDDRWSNQLLCREELSGRCYWEVEWRGRSWCLICFDWDSYCIRHDNRETLITFSSSSSSSAESHRAAVYVDYAAGSLSFFRVSDSPMHIYTFNTTFTEALYPGFELRSGSWLSLVDPAGGLSGDPPTVLTLLIGVQRRVPLHGPAGGVGRTAQDDGLIAAELRPLR
uniref:Ig-like domain-containing protein n=1 Tax=Oryzias latipes TaxID=8090 RepID=A0A3P9JMJ9_ORYLA